MKRPHPRGRQPALSAATRDALTVLGETLKAARLARRLVQADLAERLGVSRYTVMAIERGDARVAIGSVLEAAVLLGVPLVAEDRRTLAAEAQAATTLLRFLPARGRRRPVRLNDDF